MTQTVCVLLQGTLQFASSVASSWSRRTMCGSSVVVSPRHLPCLAPLAVAVDQEVRCPDCPSQFGFSASASSMLDLSLPVGWIALSAISRLQILPDLRHFWLPLSFMGMWSILIVPLPIMRSIPSSFLMIFLFHLQSTLSVALASVALLSSNLWMTVVWSGHLFTRPLMARRRGSLSGSVVLVEHPLRFLTSLRGV